MRSRLSRSDVWLLSASAVLTVASGATRYADVGRVAPFVVSALALGVLAAVVGRSVDRLGDRLGSGMTGVVQSALGNLPELFFGIFALRAGLVGVVQAALIGSILANVLLVLGLAFIVGGLRHGTQRFSADSARVIVVLLVLAVSVVMIPTFGVHLDVAVRHHRVALSNIVPVVLLVVFVLSAPRSVRREVGEPTEGDIEIAGTGTDRALDEPEGQTFASPAAWSISLVIVALLASSVAAAVRLGLVRGSSEPGAVRVCTCRRHSPDWSSWPSRATPSRTSSECSSRRVTAATTQSRSSCRALFRSPSS